AAAGADGDLGGTSSGGMSPSFPGETTDDDGGDDEGPQAPF
ncbi:NifU family protein, partial [Halorubrum sp. SS5]